MDFDVEGMRSMLETAWDRVTADISGGGRALSTARRSWIDAFAEGRDTRRIEIDLKDGLLRSHWDWPWHREWFERFSAARMWPSQWGLTSRAAVRLEQGFPEAETAREREQLRRAEIGEIEENAIHLVTQTIFKIAYTERDRRQHAAFDPAFMQRMRRSWELWGDLEPPAIIEAIIDPQRPAFAALYPSPDAPLPPFFPGDSTSVRLSPHSPRSSSRS